MSKPKAFVIIGLTAALSFTLMGAAALLLTNPDPPSQQEVQDMLAPENHPAPSILITEFADFNCPYCAEFALAYYPQIKEDFLSNPKVMFEFRHYPFLEESSWQAALAYECAQDQHLHQQFHDMAFAQHLRPEGPDFTPEGLALIARVAGADSRIFDTCMWQKAHAHKVEQDHAIGKALRIPGTPAIFLNGARLEFANYQDIRNAIERALALSQDPATR